MNASEGNVAPRGVLGRNACGAVGSGVLVDAWWAGLVRSKERIHDVQLVRERGCERGDDGVASR